ncbi:ribosomal-protein-alanine N-acetyltransferase [Nocardioides albidus]|uniref:[Ribosomal protein bS18]-alanine N-acetyltransferase n=1 Tax=Nocardioides albidus TaxID=1517589 RepID=A0A5C4VMB2_9ACTN|nr:ribosomal protein S18-alanine N-acetyltransferase [Nocardioides albidus]TNM36675.1 ribosomal-protein-alanine N-acetyltransferase [Nocardioides albidus]
MTTTTRSATVADVAPIVALEADSFPLDPWSDNLVREGVVGSLPTVTYLVAEEDGAFAGYAVLSVVDVDAELQRIAVPEQLRRTGIATALLAAARTVAAGGGAERLLLEVREDNLAALLFYERHGFTELGRRLRYYRDGTDARVLSSPVTMVP